MTLAKTRHAQIVVSGFTRKLDQRSRPSTRAKAVRTARSWSFEAGTRDLALQDGELMAQDEDLDVLGPVTATSQHRQVDHEPDETEETGHAVI